MSQLPDEGSGLFFAYAFSASWKNQNQDKQKKWCCGYEGCGEGRNPACAGLLFFSFKVISTVASYQEAMCIYTVGGTSDKCDIIFLLIDLQVFNIIRKDGPDLVYLIDQGLIKYPDCEPVSGFQLIYVGKESGGGQPSVSWQDWMGTRTSYRKGGSFQMTYGGLENFFAASVIDWKA